MSNTQVKAHQAAIERRAKKYLRKNGKPRDSGWKTAVLFRKYGCHTIAKGRYCWVCRAWPDKSDRC